MSMQVEKIHLNLDNEVISGTLVSPGSKIPGILFIHGWGGNQERDLARAKGIAGLGCICLTFDLRGHEKTQEQQAKITRQDSLEDILTAYDRLAAHPAVDTSSIAVIGTSYGGYLAAILPSLRPIKWLALRAPALYWDEEWNLPKQALNREKLRQYRQQQLAPHENRALAICAEFTGDVLLVESEKDDVVPHAVLMNYRNAFHRAISLTHRTISGADHALSTDADQKAYTSVLTSWLSEMVMGERIGKYPYYSAIYS